MTERGPHRPVIAYWVTDKEARCAVCGRRLVKVPGNPKEVWHD